MEKRHERQIWLPVANLCVPGLLKENGESTPLSPLPVAKGKADTRRHRKASRRTQPGRHAGLQLPERRTSGRCDLPAVAVPADHPAALLDYLKAGKKWTNDDPSTEIGDLIREAIIPPAVAAALYRVAALLPGATLVPDATNAAGRPGSASCGPELQAPVPDRVDLRQDHPAVHRRTGLRPHDGSGNRRERHPPACLHREGGPAAVADQRRFSSRTDGVPAPAHRPRAVVGRSHAAVTAASRSSGRARPRRGRPRGWRPR